MRMTVATIDLPDMPTAPCAVVGCDNPSDGVITLDRLTGKPLKGYDADSCTACNEKNAARLDRAQAKRRAAELATGQRLAAGEPPEQRTVLDDGYAKVQMAGLIWVVEHRAAMAAKLGRELIADENVHHLNGDRSDNAPANLELWSKMQPTGQRIADKVAWAKALLARYEPEALAVDNSAAR